MAAKIKWHRQRCIAKNGGGYMQRGVANGLKVLCLFMITEVRIRCQKNPDVGIGPTPYTPQYTTGHRYETKLRHCHPMYTQKSRNISRL